MILDASVVLKAYLPEADAADADKALQRTDVASTSLLIAELGHVLTKHVRGRLLSPEAAARIWAALRALPIRLVDDTAHADSALALSIALHATYYDCLYLALEIAEGDVLVTADSGFVSAVGVSPTHKGRVITLADAAL